MYGFDSRVRYSETDAEGKLGIPGIVDYFQDVSTFQSEDLGLGVDYLKGIGLVWVMSAWQIVIHAYPKLGDRIRVGTFPYGFRGFLGMRNFFLDGEDGRRMVEANSVWTLMNLEKGIPARPTREMIERYALEERLPMDYAPRKIAVPAGGEVPWLSCSPGPARYAPTFFISPDVWSPFCFEIVLHPGQSISALDLSHSS